MTDTFAHDELERIRQEMRKLTPAEYGMRRANWSADIGCPPALLDKEFSEIRKGQKAEGEVFPTDEPFEAPVSLDRLLHAVKTRIAKHIVFSDAEAVAVTLWIAFSWTHSAFVHSVMLLVTSAEMGSGKSTLLGLVRFLTPRGFSFTSISPAVLFRMIEKWGPTIILDEADTAFAQNEELRAIVNSGWTRGSGVPRCHPETLEPEIFSTFGPKAIGMKGKKIPDTTLSRSIVIEMKRKHSDEKCEDFEHVDDFELSTFRRMFARFAADSIDSLKQARPAMPEGFHNRLAANSRPLLAIADLAGGAWTTAARKALVDLAPKEAESTGTILLSDIRMIFDGRAGEEYPDKITSADLCTALHGFDDRPWIEFGRSQKPITAAQLARLLRSFAILSGTIRLGYATAKGYHRWQFEDAFTRYLPGGVLKASHRHNDESTGLSDTFPAVTQNEHVTDEKRKKPAPNGHCDGVTDAEAEIRADDDFEERAAVLEFEGGFDRHEAERLAAADLDRRGGA